MFYPNTIEDNILLATEDLACQISHSEWGSPFAKGIEMRHLAAFGPKPN